MQCKLCDDDKTGNVGIVSLTYKEEKFKRLSFSFT